ncbi:MAG: crotonase/enoyl-CoA hydratase family protein [Rhodopseudomonas sp.]|nr:crotonase/enoyl-CoA hydratase family protein [Rhodopseudomonas sp.]
MTSNLVTYEIEDNVAIIGLNRPDKRNAMNDTFIGVLREAVIRAGEEADAGVIFGHGKNFSAGLDLAELASKLSPDWVRPRKRRPHPWHQTFDLIARGTIPFVAAVHGATIGGGLELAAAAHIRVSDETAFFGLPEGQRGIFVGGGGSVRIQRILGYATMADMMLTGRLYSAEDALRARLTQYLVPAGEALAKAKTLAHRIAQNTPQTNWQITNVLPRINDLSHDDGLFMEYLNSSMARPPETLGRLKSFLEKRTEPLLRPAPPSAE